MQQIIRYREVSIPMLFAGPGWIAVEKPAGLSVNNDPPADLVSIVTSRMKKHKDLSKSIDWDPKREFRAVHRLDKETSGVIMLASDVEMLRYLVDQFQRRKVEKRYLALLHGRFSRIGKKGSWKRPLSQQAGGRNNPAGTGPKKRAVTCYRVLAHSFHYTYLECLPETGRKHQIRRHAKLAGHPVVGDRRYGSKRAAAFLENRMGFSRLGLHSETIRIRILEEEEPKLIRSQGLPPEIKNLFEEDGNDGFFALDQR